VQLIKEMNFSPIVKVDEANKTVYIKEGVFFNNITEAYYTLKGYSIKRRLSDKSL